MAIEIKVFAVGSFVTFTDSLLSGNIKTVSITDTVEYEIVYWVGEERKTCWVRQFEVYQTSEQDSMCKIGFLG